MTKHITVSDKGQIAVPNSGKVMDIDALQAVNQKILQHNQRQATDYQSGDGFRGHTQKKYGL